MKNPNAYDLPAWAKKVELRVVVALDPVPGAWHDPDDIVQWLFQHNYIQSVETLEREAQSA